jgi:hypothetical protein
MSNNAHLLTEYISIWETKKRLREGIGYEENRGVKSFLRMFSANEPLDRKPHKVIYFIRFMTSIIDLLL